MNERMWAKHACLPGLFCAKTHATNVFEVKCGVCMYVYRLPHLQTDKCTTPETYQNNLPDCVCIMTCLDDVWTENGRTHTVNKWLGGSGQGV